MIMAAVFSFSQVFILWALFDTARLLEDPFGQRDTDLHLDRATFRLNEALMVLLKDETRHQPTLKGCSFKSGGDGVGRTLSIPSRTMVTRLWPIVTVPDCTAIFGKRELGYSGHEDVDVYVKAELTYAGETAVSRTFKGAEFEGAELV